jgi:DNA-binding response OmpR family regulator
MPPLTQEVQNGYPSHRPFKPTTNEIACIDRKKVLVVDDDPDMCFGLHIRLKASYYETCFANDAESAVSMALTEVPDLIILDLGLPGDDGYVVMHKLSAFPDLADVPIIVLTARNRFIHERRARIAGARRFFEKPIDDRRLLVAIRQLVG